MQCKARFHLVVPHLVIFLTITAVSLVPRPSHAQRVDGRVIDAETKAPLAFASVVIVGSAKGAMSLGDGQFTITGIAVGTYKIKAMMMGYKTVEVANVVVNASQTTEISFRLEGTIVATTQRIDVFAERKKVEVASSDVRASVSEKHVREMPVDSAIDAIALKTGIVTMGDELHL